MTRYCYGHPNAVGFVISQDGEVRAITRIGRRPVIWDNIPLKDVW